MSLGDSFGEKSVQLLVNGAQQLLGRDLTDTEKQIVADLASQLKALMDAGTTDLKSVIDYAVAAIAGKRGVISISISIEEKEKS